MKWFIYLAAAIQAATPSVFAQGLPLVAPQNVLQLSASASVETQQDLLRLNLTTTREGVDANAVQNQLKAALDSALVQARKAALPGALDVRTGNFGVGPRYGLRGKINGWQGIAELVLEGRDFPRITQTAATIQSMTVAGVSFGLSREQRAKVEGEAQASAIDLFKTKARELAKSFGFSGYDLREVAVNSNDQNFVPQPRMQVLDGAPPAEATVPVEAGKSSVTVTVSGTVQLK
jgi:predicted secreted protein